jgi:hypothetical protein
MFASIPDLASHGKANHSSIYDDRAFEISVVRMALRAYSPDSLSCGHACHLDVSESLTPTVGFY